MQSVLVLTLVLAAFHCSAQNTDSVYHELQEVEIKAVSQESQLRLLSSEGTIVREEHNKQPSQSLVPAINTIPGVRMEERSPGSYRLSVRGSLLRSPFGVRNIKIYLGDLPFTDAGGNTYLNSLDPGNLNGIKVLKGPEASIFGANTGGALLIDPVYKSADSTKIIADVSTGSYRLVRENFLVQKKNKNSLFTFNQGYQSSGGYRKNSAMQRHYAQLSEIWTFSSKAQLRLFLIFSDMSYQTPGGLTEQQYRDDSRQARPSTLALPGAEHQKAAVYNRIFFGGITYQIRLSEKTKHVVSVFGSRVNFKNPFITNFEQRAEATCGARTYLDGTFGNNDKVAGKWDLGFECQQTNSDISNSGNRNGSKDTLQTTDRLKAIQAFAFTRFLTDIEQVLLLEVSCSYNMFSYQYKNIFPLADPSYQQNKFDPQLMPRIAASYKITRNIAWRASASRGYSPPTVAEIRSSTSVVNKDLQAETGLNYESGFRLRDKNDKAWIDISAFYYKLKNAIVRRTDNNGNEYFINAGGTAQPGLEAQISLWIVKPSAGGFLRSMQIKGNLTYNNFTFENFRSGANDYSGNKLTGVPDYTSAENISIDFPFHLSFYGQYYYSSGIPLNDANTASAKEYHLVQVKTEWKRSLKGSIFRLYCGVDNLLNQVYSLGNDLNAAGGRYYNAAALRNYFAGIKIEF